MQVWDISPQPVDQWLTGVSRGAHGDPRNLVSVENTCWGWIVWHLDPDTLEELQWHLRRRCTVPVPERLVTWVQVSVVDPDATKIQRWRARKAVHPLRVFIADVKAPTADGRIDLAASLAGTVTALPVLAATTPALGLVGLGVAALSGLASALGWQGWVRRAPLRNVPVDSKALVLAAEVLQSAAVLAQSDPAAADLVRSVTHRVMWLYTNDPHADSVALFNQLLGATLSVLEAIRAAAAVIRSHSLPAPMIVKSEAPYIRDADVRDMVEELLNRAAALWDTARINTKYLADQ